MNTPNWPPKDWRALAALVFSVAGAVALTWLLYLLSGMLLPEKGWTPDSENERVTTIRWVLWLSAFCILLVLTGLGFAINRRSLRGRWGDKSLNWEGGDVNPDEQENPDVQKTAIEGGGQGSGTDR